MKKEKYNEILNEIYNEARAKVVNKIDNEIISDEGVLKLQSKTTQYVSIDELFKIIYSKKKGL